MTAEDLRVYGMKEMHGKTHRPGDKSARAFLMHAADWVVAPALAGSHKAVGA